jgi:hypothetical protein
MAAELSSGAALRWGILQGEGGHGLVGHNLCCKEILAEM